MPVERLKYLKGSGFQAALRHRHKKWCVGSKRSPPPPRLMCFPFEVSKSPTLPPPALSPRLCLISQEYLRAPSTNLRCFFLPSFLFWENISHMPALSDSVIFHGEVSCSWIFIYFKVNGPPLRGLDFLLFFLKRDF